MAVRRIPAGGLVVSCGLNIDEVAGIPGYDQEMICAHEGVLAARLRSGLTSVVAASDVVHARDLVSQATQAHRSAVVLTHEGGFDALSDKIGTADLAVAGNVEMVGDTNDISHLTGPKVLVGDVHNSWRTLDRLIDAAVVAHGDDTLIVSVGDLLNKGGRYQGLAALETIERVTQLINSGRMVAIKGNHEYQVGKVLRNGSETKGFSGRTVAAIRSHADADALAASTIALIDAMPSWLRIDENTVATHAGWRPHLLNADSARQRRHFEATCQWGGSGSWVNEYDGDDLVVVGHIPQDAARFDGRILWIDTGTYLGGPLSGYVAGSDPTDGTSFLSVDPHVDDLRSDALAA
ncbi:MAG: hypothetical protein GY882_01840 [Actinomycetia bacterium]|nr:hypothetical protein [Actinomycetes bacterium]MCP4844912.1 hypothetical protein [Actinomycetes bacterium]